ncbi:DUF3159 domain-containing protein [Saccharopolyspora elongata]|uniref:DUF3159 domain-containing protein n=1 Tax=Saccharopolyspora elongata TaxID=2530387 RepID=A0A4R4YAD6_9PSEU|nr:DUF3159 domain-containing protein [Saccharopolyspora elongata]TDD40980.1 DUF3159 domain-containing protein [Saccharopolyspora elongata]
MAPSPPQEDDRADDTEPDVRKRARGALIDIAPILCFTLSFALTQRLTAAVAFALAAGVGTGIYRLVRREPAWRALGALGVVCVGSALAAHTEDATNFFLPGLVIQGVTAAVTPVLLAFGWPPLALVAGLVTGERTRWRRCPIRRRAFTRANLVLFATKVVLLSVELPLFLAGQTVTLGFTNAAGPFVHGLGALLAWRVFRRAAGTHRCARATDRCDARANAPDPLRSPAPQETA